MRSVTKIVVVGTAAGAATMAARRAMAYAVGSLAALASSFEAEVQKLSAGQTGADDRRTKELPPRLASDRTYRSAVGERIIDLRDESSVGANL